MKEKFYNSEGCNTVKITVETNNNEIELYYHLGDNPVQHRWQTLIAGNNKFKMGKSLKISPTEIINEINRLILPMGLTKLSYDVSQDELNWLHTKFVETPESTEWQNINLYIHLLEDKRKEGIFSGMFASQRFYADPEPKYIPLLEEHKLWLTTEKCWGSLLLGYATLGKGWWEICQDSDNAKDLALQEAIGTETLMIFQPEPVFKDVENKFYPWAKSSNLNVPLGNLNQLAMGRYYLGKIIITDEFLKYHPTASDWYVPNHRCRLMWAKEVIGADARVTSVDFFNSDMYYNSLIMHTQLGDII